MASTGANASPGSPGHASRKPTPKTPGQKPGFLANTKREMRMEILGEGTPGPGSYLPASTFGKYSKSASSKMSKMQSSAFKSTSKQRPVNKATSVPGPGSHSPNHQATSREKKGNNPGANMKSKGERFASEPGSPTSPKKGPSEPGPGYYDAHTHKTIQTFLSAKRERMSRQNPGFGASSPAHTLPYELDIANDQKAFVNVSTSGSGEMGGYGIMGGAGAGAGAASFKRRQSIAPPTRQKEDAMSA